MLSCNTISKYLDFLVIDPVIVIHVRDISGAEILASKNVLRIFVTEKVSSAD
jgi:hypothetical protein